MQVIEPHGALQTLLDRAAIHDRHVRYFQAVDSSDQGQVRLCFTDDVEAHYHGRAPVRGIDALIASMAIFANHADVGARLAELTLRPHKN